MPSPHGNFETFDDVRENVCELDKRIMEDLIAETKPKCLPKVQLQDDGAIISMGLREITPRQIEFIQRLGSLENLCVFNFSVNETPSDDLSAIWHCKRLASVLIWGELLNRNHFVGSSHSKICQLRLQNCVLEEAAIEELSKTRTLRLLSLVGATFSTEAFLKTAASFSFLNELQIDKDQFLNNASELTKAIPQAQVVLVPQNAIEDDRRFL